MLLLTVWYVGIFSGISMQQHHDYDVKQSSKLEYHNYTKLYIPVQVDMNMMTSWNGDIFRVTGLLWREFTGHRWIPLTKASDVELCCFFFDPRLNERLSKQ